MVKGWLLSLMVRNKTKSSLDICTLGSLEDLGKAIRQDKEKIGIRLKRKEYNHLYSQMT